MRNVFINEHSAFILNKTKERCMVPLMKKFIKPIKSMTELLMWEDKIKEIAPLSIKAFFVIALDTGISPQIFIESEMGRYQNRGSRHSHTKNGAIF